MSEEEKRKAKEIRNIKERERYAKNEESKQRRLYNNLKSYSKRFVKIATLEHLQELENQIKERKKNL